MNNYMNTLAKVKKVYSFWGRFPLFYVWQDYFTFMGRPKFVRGQAVKRLNLRSGDKALEVACGSGRNFSFIMGAIGQGGRLVGFDYSQEMLDAAQKLRQKKNWDNIKLIQGDAAELNIGEGNFDAVISVLGISAIPDWEKALQRCYDVLKSGGILVVCDARLFDGFFSFLNPLVKLIYSRFAAWDPSKNIPEKVKAVFGNLEIENLNFGTFFIAKAIKH